MQTNFYWKFASMTHCESFFDPKFSFLPFSTEMFSHQSPNHCLVYLLHFIFRSFLFTRVKPFDPVSFAIMLHNSNLSISKTNIKRNFVWKICLTERLVRTNVTLIPFDGWHINNMVQPFSLCIVWVCELFIFVAKHTHTHTHENCNCIRRISAFILRASLSIGNHIDIRKWFEMVCFFRLFLSLSFSISFSFLSKTHSLHHNTLFADITNNSPLNKIRAYACMRPLGKWYKRLIFSFFFFCFYQFSM